MSVSFLVANKLNVHICIYKWEQIHGSIRSNIYRDEFILMNVYIFSKDIPLCCMVLLDRCLRMWWALHSILWIYRSSIAAVAERRGRGEKDTMQALFSTGVVHSIYTFGDYNCGSQCLSIILKKNVWRPWPKFHN